MNKQRIAFYSVFLMGLLLLGSVGESHASERVVSLNGSLTEIVYALGQEDKLVGVDTTSLYPEAATELASVGYQRALSAEGIASLQPSLILSTNHAGPEVALEQIAALGVKRIVIEELYTLENVLEKIEQVAQALNQPEAGQSLATLVATDTQRAINSIPDASSAPRTVFFLGTGEGSPSVAGGQTAANAMIKLAGGENPFSKAFTSYKPVNAESMLLAAPQVILVSSRAFESSNGIEGILALPGVAETPAGQNKRIYSVDTLLTLGFGPRMALATSTLIKQIHKLD